MNTLNNSIKWLLLDEPGQLVNYKHEWENLCVHNADSLFSSPDWILNWINIYWQPSWKLHTLIGFRGDLLVALLPFYLQKSPNIFSINCLLPLGQGEPEESEICSEYQDVLFNKNDTELFQSVIGQIKNIPYDTIQFRNLLPCSNWSKLVKHLPHNTIRATGQRYCISKKSIPPWVLSKNNKKKLNASKNKLASIGATFKWVSGDKFMDYWPILRDFHQHRWENKGKNGAFSSDEFSKFHHLYSRTNKIKFSIIEIDNLPIAINYYLLSNNYLYFYQSGWDQKNYSKLSPGFALHVWSIQNNFADNYDFMVGGHSDSYKKRYGCNNIQDIISITVYNSKMTMIYNKLINNIYKIVGR
tara:strand:- start:204 stop:1274 length:1071 start_codon:yes stop_codon:yes gene_type:complete